MLANLFGGRAGRAERREPTFFAASPENPATDLANPVAWLNDWAAGGMPGTFGPLVSERTAMACSAVYRCVALLSGLIASLPLKIYRRTTDGRDELPTHRLAPMFQMAPYPGRAMTAFTWRELWAVNELLWGDHISAIRYDGAARIIGFEPAMPWDVEVYRVNQRNLYRCTFWDGATARIEWLDQEDVLHIPGLGFNGLRGMSRIRANARNSVSLSLMLLEQIGRVHDNSARPSGIMTIPGADKDVLKRYQSEFEQAAVGRANAGKVLWTNNKESGFTPLQMSPEDLNTIDLMRFGVADVSRFYGVPLHLLNETDKATSWGSGLSEQTLAFLIYTLEPDLGRIEAELNYKLFAGSGAYIEFDRDGLLAMDPVKAADIARAEIASGTLLINERRRQKNRPPVENGNEPLINSTNVPLKNIFLPGAQPRQDPIQTDPLAPRPDVGAPDTADTPAP